jgi:hypothetical protein
MLVGISEAIRLLSTLYLYIKYLFILFKYSIKNFTFLFTKPKDSIKDNDKISAKVNEDNNKKSFYSGKDSKDKFYE